MLTLEEKQRASFERGKRNSQISEEYVRKKYDIRINESEPLDNMKRNIEVKSCQFVLKDRFDSSFRKGIFILKKNQHNLLLGNKGNYIFILMYQNQVIADVRRNASKVEPLIFWDSTGHCRIPWNEIIPYSKAFEFFEKAPPAELMATGNFAKKMLNGY